MLEALDLDMARHVLSWIFIAAGSFFIVTSGLGIIRMPDFYTRIHPAGLIDSMGAPLVLLGLIILHGPTLVSGKILLLIVFLFITGPTATHAIAKSALLGGLKPQEKPSKDADK